MRRAAMRAMNMKSIFSNRQWLLALLAAVTLFTAQATFSAVPGISGAAGTPVFNLTEIGRAHV
jgi:hypothetical protein